MISWILLPFLCFLYRSGLLCEIAVLPIRIILRILSWSDRVILDLTGLLPWNSLRLLTKYAGRDCWGKAGPAILSVTNGRCAKILKNTFSAMGGNYALYYGGTNLYEAMYDPD